MAYPPNYPSHATSPPLYSPASPNQQCGQYVYSGIPPDFVQQLMGYVAVSERQKAELSYKLHQLLHADQSHQRIVYLNGKTCILGKRNLPLELVNCTFLTSAFVEPQPPLRGEKFFLIQTSVSDMPLRITEDDFFRDSKLIAHLHSHPGVKVSLVGSQKNTASHLRLALLEHVQHFQQEAYAGWQKYGDGFHFRLFSSFSTHSGPGQMLPLASRSDQFPDFSAVAATTAKQFWPVFRLITDSNTRQMLVLCFYAAQLYTLLRELGFEIPMAPYFFSSDRDVLTYLKHVFGWYGDEAISMDMAATDFRDALLCRRDQSLLLADDGCSRRASENIRTLENTLADHHVPWKSNRDVISLPLQALPVIISGQISSLCCVPETFIIDIEPEKFDWSRWVNLLDTVSNHAEHRECFVRHTESHFDELRAALADGCKQAIRVSHGQLNERCVRTLGILLGIQEFLQQFFRFCSPAIPPVKFNDSGMSDYIFHVMKEASEKEFLTSLPAQFIYVAGQHIRKGRLKLCSRMRASNDANVVYADDERLHFTASAFLMLCNAMHQSRPVILRALASEGMLLGAQTNPGTAQTRIHVYSAYGCAQKVAVYSIERAALEELGDPFVVEGGNI